MKRHGLIMSMLAFALAFFAMSIHAAVTYPDMAPFVKPNPQPALPAEMDSDFNPPVDSSIPATSSPSFAEWTRTGGPDDCITATSTSFSSYTGVELGKDSNFLVFGQSTNDNSVMNSAKVQRLDTQKAVVTLDTALPSGSMYLLWAHNSNGYGRPVAINRTDAWWLGPDRGSIGASISAFGRNLSHGNGTSASWIYIKPAGVAGQWVTPSAVNPYKVTFTIPSLPTGSYEVWVHNGHGRNYGWSGPLSLTVNSGPGWTSTYFNVKDAPYYAKGDGITDDTAAIKRCMADASAVPFSTIYLPAGTYMVSSQFTPSNNNRWQGAGKALTTIKCAANFSTDSYCLVFNDGGNVNVELRDMTFDSNTYCGSLNILVRFRQANELRFTNVALKALTFMPLDLQGSSYIYFNGCDVTGMTSFIGSGRQLFIDNCNYYGANDGNTMWEEWARSDISMTNCTAQDLNSSDINNGAGWAKGRFFTGNGYWGPSRHTYLGDNTSYSLSVRNHSGVDANSGEQFMWEGNNTTFSDMVASATATTATFYTTTTNYVNDLEAVVVAGTGLGQHSKISAWDPAAKTITLSTPWNVIPDTTSRIDCGHYVVQCVAYHNSLDGKANFTTFSSASSGIQPYGGFVDFIAANNTLTRLRYGISSWVIADNTSGSWQLQPTFFNLYSDNNINNCMAGIVIPGTFWDGSATNDPGIGYFGNNFRRNSTNNLVRDTVYQTGGAAAIISGSAPSGVWMQHTVLEHNTGTNMYAGIDASGSGNRIANTIYYQNDLSKGTGVGTAGLILAANTQQSPALRENTLSGFTLAYAGQLPGAVLEIPYRTMTINGASNGDKVTATMTIWNSGTTALNWTATTSPASWLTLSASSGTVLDENSDSNVTLTCNPTGLAQGAYTATVTVTGASQTKMVTVTFQVGPPTNLPQRPDLSVRPSTVTMYAGMGIYNLDGTGQTASLAVARGAKATYYVHVQNNGTSADTLKITGTPTPAGWTVEYKNYTTGVVITSEVTGGGWNSPVMKPGALLTLSVSVIPGSTIYGGSNAAQTVTVTSVGDASKKDVGVLKTSIPLVNKPDLSLRSSTVTAYTGDRGV